MGLGAPRTLGGNLTEHLLPNLSSSDRSARASSRWLQPSALEQLVGFHLERTLEVGRNPILGQGPAKTLRLSAEGRRRLPTAGGGRSARPRSTKSPLPPAAAGCLFRPRILFAAPANNLFLLLFF